MPFVVGESVGPCRITRQLGVGGMATVGKADHPAPDIEPEHVKAHLCTGDAYLVQGELDASASHHQTVVDLDPEVPGSHSKLGMCNVLQGDVEMGRQECEPALRMDPQVPEGHLCMGLYFENQADTGRARSEFEIVVETAPGVLAEPARRQLDRLD